MGIDDKSVGQSGRVTHAWYSMYKEKLGMVQHDHGELIEMW